MEDRQPEKEIQKFVVNDEDLAQFGARGARSEHTNPVPPKPPAPPPQSSGKHKS